MKFIHESIYCHRTGRISNCLKRLLHEVSGCVPAIILFSFVNWKSFQCSKSYPKKLFHILQQNENSKLIWVLLLLIWTINLVAKPVPHNLGIICSISFFQFRWLSICKPRNFVFSVSAIYFFFITKI